ncbi:MAG: phospho-N-acetylmuramoyl-pentapeptide-transferase [Psychroflexus sp.]|nr:phospho-N-acetylmuramoyl-pentapeptide-transferase [Psychroflexus sp.]
MLYHLFEYLQSLYDIPGARLFSYLSFRASMAIIFSLLTSLVFGKKIINYLTKKQIGERVRELGLEGQKAKAGTPTMGGLIIIFSTLLPVLLFTRLDNIYIILLLITTIWMGVIGFIDDYIKTFKSNKEGLKGKFKVIGQVGLGIVVGATMYFHQDIQLRKIVNDDMVLEKSTKTTIPFVKNNELDYADAITWISPDWSDFAWLIFIPIVIFIITAVSNGANLTDGIDGLAAGNSAIIVLTLGVFSWISGNVIFSDYLNVMNIPLAGEMSVFIAAFTGALIGFLWYNTYPAQIFMGDTGSLTIGGIIAVIAIATRKELLIPILCGVFFIENLSVVMQVAWFKYTKKKFGEGRRIFLMSPLHHHYQKKGYHESKIVVRFWIIGILLAVITIVTLKIR